MARILCIETTGKCCSVALQSDSGEVFNRIECGESYIHAESLHPFIEDVLNRSGLRPEELRAVAVSAGPGSYTGLRIGVSAAKGFAFSLGIPLLAIGTLELMAKSVIARFPGYETYVPMLDARRMEVYTQTFTSNGDALGEPCPVVVDSSFFAAITGDSLVFFGSGADKCSGYTGRREILIPGIEPRAEDMLPIAAGLFESGQSVDLAYFEPFYLKEFVAGRVD